MYVASKDVLRATVGFDLHRGAVAAADRRPLPSVADAVAGARRVAVLEGLNDPENLGAVARSARAFGIDALVIDPTCIDPYYRRTVRVSMGEVLHLPVARAGDWPGDLAMLAGFETWALTPDAGAESIWDLAVPPRVAVVLGAEGPGLSAAGARGGRPARADPDRSRRGLAQRRARRGRRLRRTGPSRRDAGARDGMTASS